MTLWIMSLCSPLFVLLQALINASNADGALDNVKDSVLYLICIFRAIKRSEDVIDVERTPVRIFPQRIAFPLFHFMFTFYVYGKEVFLTMQKLHVLADIGHSFVTLTNHNGLSASHAPGQILLPSSLYKVSIANKSVSCFGRKFQNYFLYLLAERKFNVLFKCSTSFYIFIICCLQSNSRCLTQSCFDEHFVKRVIQIFKSNISLVCICTVHLLLKFMWPQDCLNFSLYFCLDGKSLFTFQPASTLPKRGRKCQEDRTQADVVKDNKLILASCKIVNLSKDGRAEAQKPEKEGNSTGGRRRKRALSPSAPGSVAFHDCSNNDYPSGVSKKSETSLEKEILSSCDSVATISSLGGSNVSIQNFKSNTIDVEHSNHPRAKLKGPCSLKVRISSPVQCT